MGLKCSRVAIVAAHHRQRTQLRIRRSSTARIWRYQGSTARSRANSPAALLTTPSRFNRALPSSVRKRGGPICSTKTCRDEVSFKLHIMRARPFKSSGCPARLVRARSTNPRRSGRLRRKATHTDDQPQAVCRSMSRVRRPSWAPHVPPYMAWFSIPTDIQHPRAATTTLRIIAPCFPARTIVPRLRRPQHRLARAATLHQRGVGTRQRRRPSSVMCTAANPDGVAGQAGVP